MHTGLATTALLMGLAGGPHCVAMCGAACGGIVRLGGAPAWKGMLQWQAGRLLGYGLSGALAAFAVQNLAWLTEQTAALRPVWTLFHALVLVWGLSLLLLARQPAWVDGIGHRFWSSLRHRLSARSAVFVIGLAWTLMPCGLLYSALLVASLSGGPLDGLVTMLCFALGSSLSLSLGPWLWLRLAAWRDPARQTWSMRAAGAALTAVALWSLVMDLDPRFVELCRQAVGV